MHQSLKNLNQLWGTAGKRFQSPLESVRVRTCTGRLFHALMRYINWRFTYLLWVQVHWRHTRQTSDAISVLESLTLWQMRAWWQAAIWERYGYNFKLYS